MRALTLSLAGAAATMLSLGAVLAQPADTGGGGARGPRAGGPATRPAVRPGDADGPRFHLIPPFAAERMKLTEEQRKQIKQLANETKAKLDSILTPEQRKILQEARPPRPGQGPGGPGGPADRRGGPGGPGGRPGGPGGPGGGPAGGGANG